MHDWNEQISGEKNREFFVCNTFALKALQQRGGHQNYPNTRFRQPFVDFTEQSRTKKDILLAEPDRYSQ